MKSVCSSYADTAPGVQACSLNEAKGYKDNDMKEFFGKLLHSLTMQIGKLKQYDLKRIWDHVFSNSILAYIANVMYYIVYLHQ